MVEWFYTNFLSCMRRFMILKRVLYMFFYQLKLELSISLHFKVVKRERCFKGYAKVTLIIQDHYRYWISRSSQVLPMSIKCNIWNPICYAYERIAPYDEFDIDIIDCAYFCILNWSKVAGSSYFSLVWCYIMVFKSYNQIIYRDM